MEWLSGLLDAQLGALVGRSEAAHLLAQLQVPAPTASTPRLSEDIAYTYVWFFYLNSMLSLPSMGCAAPVLATCTPCFRTQGH